MPLPWKRRAWSTPVAMTLTLCAGCALNSPPPVVAPPVQLTPLPSSVERMPRAISPAYSEKVLTWLSKVDAWLSNVTPK